MKENKGAGIQRAHLLTILLDKNLSESTVRKITGIIKNTRLSNKANEDIAADKKAAELTELINRCQTEEEILEAIKEI